MGQTVSNTRSVVCYVGHTGPDLLESFGLPIAEGDPGPGRLPYGEWLPRSFVQPDRTIVGDRHDVLDPRAEPAR